MLGLDVLDLLVRIPVVLLALTGHEVCHGYFADRMGDPTARLAGRLSLNPLRHLDPLGALCLLFAPIGWAKPVPVNVLNFRNRRAGILVSTAAGPLSNVVQAVVFALALRGILQAARYAGPGAPPQMAAILGVLSLVCLIAVVVNLGLAIFNGLPLYPLDGYHVLTQLLPPAGQRWLAGTATYGPFAILALVLAGPVLKVDLLGAVLRPAVKLFLQHLAGFDWET